MLLQEETAIEQTNIGKQKTCVLTYEKMKSEGPERTIRAEDINQGDSILSIFIQY